MNFRKRLVGLLGIGSLALLLLAQPASGTHPRPKGASPTVTSLVLAYHQCPNTAPPANRQHGAPLDVVSCNPPVQTSNFLTVGTGDAWPGTIANSVGSVSFDVKTTSPEDVLIDVSITDVRCKDNSAPGFCTNANTDNPGLPDYSGQIDEAETVRFTDHYNGPIGQCGSCTDPATLNDWVMPVELTCTATPADGTEGSICSTATTWDAVILGFVQDNKRANAELEQVDVFDGGADGTHATTTDNTLFETQGVFVP